MYVEWQNDNNSELTLSDNLHIKPTAAIGFTVYLLL